MDSLDEIACREDCQGMRKRLSVDGDVPTYPDCILPKDAR